MFSARGSAFINRRPTVVTVPREARTQIDIGPCSWIVERLCPDKDVKFFLYTRKNLNDRQLIHADETMEKSNISASNFNPTYPTKIVIHGYNSDMFLTPLIDMKEGWSAFVSTNQRNINAYAKRDLYFTAQNTCNEVNTIYFMWIGVFWRRHRVIRVPRTMPGTLVSALPN